jgi:sialate O-acetylesterase
LPVVFTDNMVIQRDRSAPVWGWAAPGERVTVRFADQTRETVADPQGRWRVALAPLPASAEGRELVVAGSNTVRFANVLVGEVWICSGQSNMEWPLARALDGASEAAAANFPLIRLLNLPHTAHNLPQENTSGAWTPCTSNSAPGFSAVGYFFGRKLFQELNVPIGLINASWGGTRIEPWTPPVGFHSVPELAALSAQVDVWDARTPTGKVAFAAAITKLKAWLPEAEKALAAGQRPPDQPRMPEPAPDHQQPTRIYNSMIHPLAPLALRGAIWYQGESNGGEGDTYYWKTRALVNGWREVFANPDLSFYFVQLANYQGDSQTPQGGTGYALIRDAQRRSLTIPRTGMAVIIDIGEAGDIHPRNKLDVGLRLAAWALARDYGKAVVFSGPLYKSHTIDANRIRLTFDSVGGGLMVGMKKGMDPTQPVPGGQLKRFAIAGADKVWQWADAVIDGDTVVVSHAQVPAPVAVRYAYDANPIGCNLYNREGFPASPFRTDTW